MCYQRHIWGCSNEPLSLLNEKVGLFRTTCAAGVKAQIQDERSLHRENFHTYNVAANCENLLRTYVADENIADTEDKTTPFFTIQHAPYTYK